MSTGPISVFEPHPQRVGLKPGLHVLAVILLFGSCLNLVRPEPLGILSPEDRIDLKVDGVRMFQQRRFVPGFWRDYVDFDRNGRCKGVTGTELSAGGRIFLKRKDPIGLATKYLGHPEINDQDSMGIIYIYKAGPYRVDCWTQQGRILTITLKR